MIRIQRLKVPLEEMATIEKLAARRLRVSLSDVESVRLVHKAVDARRYRGAPLCFVYTVDVKIAGREGLLLERFSRDRDVVAAPAQRQPLWETLRRGEGRALRPVVVGFGPAGMMAALVLARAGLSPLVLERGADVDTRREAVERFWQGGAFDPSTNVQFGEGGAGTFSDGKLTSRSSDPHTADVLEAFIAAGAPEEIRYLHKPHLGTDRLRGIVRQLRQEILSAGGEVRFGAQVTDIELGADGVSSVVVNDDVRIGTEAVFLGIGHSARDTCQMLLARGIAMAPKAFSVGLRIEHPQGLIDQAQYGVDAGHPLLSAADYALTFQDTATGRGAYSFCMCPGGQVVAAASERGHLTTNGMSLYRRDSGVANAALLVTVAPEDFGGTVEGGIAFQRRYEALAFQLGGADYCAPVQTVGDFLTGRTGSRDFLVTPTYQPGVVPANLRNALPDFVALTLAHALPVFGARIPGFSDAGAPLTGVEMRSSSPYRILRDPATFAAVCTPGLFPMGEGAGYAGGIMSAAVDGLRAALAFLAKIGHTVLE
ncbi:MAG: NAD(P)/FAD-dependent oxidoreductase [Schwartzia sp. (in: firmicutes)]